MDNKPLILAIDDDAFYLNEIRMELKGRAECKLFQGPTDFAENVTEADIKDAKLIIVDYDYGGGTAVKSGMADFIRNKLGYKGKLVMWSLHEYFGKDDAAIRRDYDVMLPKGDLYWDKLEVLL